MKKGRCAIEGCTRTEIRRTFSICSTCFRWVAPKHQKALVDNYLQGQDTGSIQPSGAFLNARKEAIGDIYYATIGTRNPDKITRDSKGVPVDRDDRVSWMENGHVMTGKVSAVYWKEQIISVRYFYSDLPRSLKDSAIRFTKIS